MKIKILNNRKKKRAFSNKLWINKGIMFPWENKKYLQLGLFGIILSFNW